MNYIIFFLSLSFFSINLQGMITESNTNLNPFINHYSGSHDKYSCNWFKALNDWARLYYILQSYLDIGERKQLTFPVLKTFYDWTQSNLKKIIGNPNQEIPCYSKNNNFLRTALINEQFHLAHLLLECGALQTIKKQDEIPLIFLAGTPKQAQLLLHYEPDQINATCQNRNIIEIAVADGSIQLLQFYINKNETLYLQITDNQKRQWIKDEILRKHSIKESFLEKSKLLLGLTEKEYREIGSFGKSSLDHCEAICNHLLKKKKHKEAAIFIQIISAQKFNHLSNP